MKMITIRRITLLDIAVCNSVATVINRIDNFSISGKCPEVYFIALHASSWKITTTMKQNYGIEQISSLTSVARFCATHHSLSLPKWGCTACHPEKHAAPAKGSYRWERPWSTYNFRDRNISINHQEIHAVWIRPGLHSLGRDHQNRPE